MFVSEVCDTFGALSVALGGGENLVAFFDIRQTVVEQCEYFGGDLFTQAVTCAEVLVDPYLHGFSRYTAAR